MWMVAAMVLGLIVLISIISNSVKSDLISTLRYENAYLKNYIQAHIDKK